jgi:hypothetical protein
MNKLTVVIATFVPGILSTMAFVRSNRQLSGCSIFGDLIEGD